MSLKEKDISLFQNPVIKEALQDIVKLSSKDSLNLKRWDKVLEIYPFSGTVKLPVRVNNVPFVNPFHYVVEKQQSEEMLFIKPVTGEPYRLGEVYGFFGFSDFDGYRRNWPIILVEGISDWAAVKTEYKYVLALLTSSVSSKQLFFLSQLTGFVVKAFDMDDAGERGRKIADKKFESVGISSINLVCPRNDWGKMIEDEYGIDLMNKTFKNLLQTNFFDVFNN